MSLVSETGPVRVAHRLYEAFADLDVEALRGLLTDDFVGEVSRGMPCDVGGRHQGPDAMVDEVWVRVFSAYDVQVVPDEYLVSAPDQVVVLGRYVGAARSGSGAVDAVFAHVITTRDGQIAALRQITDTAAWRLPVTG